MKRNAILFTAATVVAGAVAAALRRRELATVFNEAGLAQRGAPVSIALIALSVAFAAALLVFSLLTTKGKDAPGGYETVFHVENAVPIVVSALMAVAMIAGGYLNYRAQAVWGTRAIVEGAVGILAALAGIGMLSLSINARRGKSGGENCLSTVAVTAFVCFYILVTYKKRADDPVLLDYMYDFLALCFSALASYYVAGFAFDRPSPRKTHYLCFLSAFLCIIAGAGAMNGWVFVFYGFLAVYMLMHGYLLTAAMVPEQEE